jgi:Ankyrin repeats (many copies)
MDSLKDKITVTKFKKALALLPRGAGSNAIDLAYEEALNRVNSQMEGQRDLANRMLILIAYAYEPLSVLELREALSIDPDSVRFDNEAMPELEDLTDHCAGLVVVDEQRDVARLVHYTLQEYLDRIRDEKLPGGHRLFTKICMSYLTMHDWREKHPGSKRVVYCELGDEEDNEIMKDYQNSNSGSEHSTSSGFSKRKVDRLTSNKDSIDDGNDDDDNDDAGSSMTGFSYASWPGGLTWISKYLGCDSMLARHPFIAYAMTHWAKHMKADSEEYHLLDVLAFLNKIAGSKFSLLCVQFVDEAGKGCSREIIDMPMIDLNALSIAASYGLDRACESILADLSSYGNYEPLESLPLAVLGNWPNIAEKILMYNQGRSRPKPLEKAVCLHTGLIIYPLHESADYGKHRILKLLLEYGYDVDEEDDINTTALDRAAFINDVDSSRLLLQYGATTLRDDSNIDWMRQKFDWKPSAFLGPTSARPSAGETSVPVT